MSGLLRRVVTSNLKLGPHQQTARTLIAGPAKNKISAMDQVGAGAVMLTLFVAVPVWVLGNLEYYRNKSFK